MGRQPPHVLSPFEKFSNKNMQSKRSVFRTSARTRLSLILSSLSIPATAIGGNATWDGGASTNVLSTAANWTADTLPTASGDVATWDGTAPGNLSLTWTGAFGAGSGSLGTSVTVAATQVSSLLIGSSSATTSTNADNFNLGSSFSIASGAGAVTLGDGVGFDDVTLRSAASPVSNLFLNNSSNTATVAANVYFNSGGGAQRTVTFDGSGNWSVQAGLRFSNNAGMDVVKNGTGTLTLSGGPIASTGTTTHTINGGTLKVGGTGILGGVTPLAGNITNNAAFSFESSAGQTLSGVISGGGTFAQTAGALNLTNTNTYSGSTTISGGTLNVSGTGAINSSSGIAVNGAGAKYLHTSSVASTRSIALTQGTVAGAGSVGAVTVGNGTGGEVANGNASAGILTISSLAFNGAASITVTDDGNPLTSGIVVTGALATTPGNGQVNVNASNSFWNSGATYDLVSFGSFGGSASHFVLGTIGGLTSRQSASIVVSGTALGLQIAGDTPKWTGLDNSNWVAGSTGGSSNWKLIGANTATNYVEGDVVRFDDSAGNTTVTIPTANVSPAVVNFENSAKDYTLSGSFGIAGGSLNKNGTGVLTIAAPNSYAGGTVINAGTVILSGAGSLGAAAGGLDVADGTLNLGGSSQTVGALSITGEAHIQNGTLTASGLNATNPSGSAVISAALSLGAGGITKSNDGILALSGATSYSGATVLSGGTLALSGSGSLGTTSGVNLGGGSLDLGGGSLTTSAVTITSGALAGDAITNERVPNLEFEWGRGARERGQRLRQYACGFHQHQRRYLEEREPGRHHRV